MNSIYLRFTLFLYNIVLSVYYLLISISSLWDRKSKQWLRGRKNVLKYLSEKIEPTDKYIWIHCSSLGEFEQGRPVIEKLRGKLNGYKILLTFFSPSGYEIRKEYLFADLVCYLPLDTKKNAREFISITHPKVAIFVKYDFWYHYFKNLSESKIPLYLVSAVFNKNQIFFKKYGLLFLQMLKYVSHFFVQDENSLRILNEYGFKNITVIPDTRIDRVSQISVSNIPDELSVIEEFKNDKRLVVLGSSYATEEKFIKKYLSEDVPDLKIIIAPHHIDKGHIDKIINLFPNETVLWSNILIDNTFQSKKVLVVDRIGLLSMIYRFGDMAFIGGGFDKGIHNILEPAASGLPVIFGPKNYLKFKEAQELINIKGAFLIHNYNEFRDIMNTLFLNNNLTVAGNICKDYIVKNTGGTEIFINHLILSNIL